MQRQRSLFNFVELDARKLPLNVELGREQRLFAHLSGSWLATI